MSKKLIVTIARLSSGQRTAIAAAAKNNGFKALFFDDNAEALLHLSDAEVIFGSGPELTQNAPMLRWFCTPQAGVNQYLGEGAFSSPDAILSNSSGAYGTTIAEHIVMVTLDMMRRQKEYADIVNRRGWIRNLPVRSIRNARITLLGTGDIGQEAVIRLRAFTPASVTGINRSGRNPKGLFDRIVPREQMDSVLPDTDLLILSLPGTKETEGILNEARLRMMPSDSFLVNVGRGSAVDQRALERLMRAGHFAGAALDVFDQEPLPKEDSLWLCPRLLITPHVAGNTTLDYTVEKIVSLFLEDFENYCAGRPLRRMVDKKLGY